MKQQTQCGVHGHECHRVCSPQTSSWASASRWRGWPTRTAQSGSATILEPPRSTSAAGPTRWTISTWWTPASSPRARAVNPALTIMANALRVADHLKERLGLDGRDGLRPRDHVAGSPPPRRASGSASTASAASPPAPWRACSPAAITGCWWRRLQPPLGPHGARLAGWRRRPSTRGVRRSLARQSLGGRHRRARTAIAQIERFHLDGTTPVWTLCPAPTRCSRSACGWSRAPIRPTCAIGCARGGPPCALDRRGAGELPRLSLDHARAAGRCGRSGGRRAARRPPSTGARPFWCWRRARPPSPRTTWHYRGDLAREAERGLDSLDDNLHAGTFRADPRSRARAVTLRAVRRDGARPGRRRRPGAGAARMRRRSLEAWRAAQPAAAAAPAWIDQLALAADQFLVRRPLAGRSRWDDGDRGLPVVRRLGARHHDRAARAAARHRAAGGRRAHPAHLRALRGPRHAARTASPTRARRRSTTRWTPTLWYFEAVRAYVAATGDDATLGELYPVLEEIVDVAPQGTRYGIRVDPGDGLLRGGGARRAAHLDGRRVGDWVVTPRTGKPVEINALWYNALRAMAGFARRLRQPAAPGRRSPSGCAPAFDRFWNATAGYCYDVIDGPDGRRRRAPAQPDPRGVAAGEPAVAGAAAAGGRRLRAPAAHRRTGSAAWLAAAIRRTRAATRAGRPSATAPTTRARRGAGCSAPFALAHLRVHGDRAAARAFLAPLAHHLSDAGLGSIAEVFDGDAPFAPGAARPGLERRRDAARLGRHRARGAARQGRAPAGALRSLPCATPCAATGRNTSWRRSASDSS